MLDDPVFIGPIGAGKTTIATLVATVLGKPLCSMDEVRFTYYAEIGYDVQRASQIRKERGFRELYEYWKPFEAHAVERILSEKTGCVFDFGAGHAVYDDPMLLRRVQHALGPYTYVFLLLPSVSHEESLCILQERRPDLDAGALELNRYFAGHRSYSALASHTVYTKGKNPEAVRDEVLAIITDPGAGA
jgi:shikimate kinase